MGDSCCNPASMGRIKQVIEDVRYLPNSKITFLFQFFFWKIFSIIIMFFQETGGLVISLKIGLSVIDDTINGFLKPVNKQVKQILN